MAFFVQEAHFHDGETRIQQAMKVDIRDDPTVPALSPQLAHHLQIAPLIAIATLDPLNRPWTTLWGGEPGLGQSLGGGIAGIRTRVTANHDPVVETLFASATSGQVVHEQGVGRMLSGLTLDLEKRKRVKWFGRMIAGALTIRNDEITERNESVAEVQLAMKVEQSLGNCPKYLNRKRVEPHPLQPRLVSDSAQLSPAALALLERADMFFMSTCGPKNDMDTNHRGGAPGFVRVFSNDNDGAVLAYPEFSGNNLYQSLGNLAVDSRIGLCVPDFESGDMLYMTGTATILIGSDAAQVLPRSNLAVRISLVAARYVASALPFRGLALDRSPYNPKVRFLSSEKPSTIAASSENSSGISTRTATLLSQTQLTPTISRFRFRLSPAPAPHDPPFVQPGQYVTLDFAAHLDIGYSHMRDDDPRSINDDFIRTFTVSNTPSSLSDNPEVKSDEFELILRRVGAVTEFLFRHHGLASVNSRARSSAAFDTSTELDVKVIGFGGDFIVQHDDSQSSSSSSSSAIAFIAAGVGITPLLSSLPTLDLTRLHVQWSIRRADFPLVKDVLARWPDLAGCMQVFITDVANLDDAGAVISQEIAALKDAGVKVHTRRILQDDLNDFRDEKVSTVYLCTGVPMRNQILEWLPGKNVVYEDFNF